MEMFLLKSLGLSDLGTEIQKEGQNTQIYEFIIITEASLEHAVSLVNKMIFQVPSTWAFLWLWIW